MDNAPLFRIRRIQSRPQINAVYPIKPEKKGRNSLKPVEPIIGYRDRFAAQVRMIPLLDQRHLTFWGLVNGVVFPR
jgi:hypothetical protein